MLSRLNFEPVVNASTVSMARRAIAERPFDFVIINSPLKDDMGLNFAIDCNESHNAFVLFLVKNEIIEEISENMAKHGVFTLSKPLSRQSMENALRWLITAKFKLKGFEEKSAGIEKKMDEIRLVNKAKWLLISNEGMLEPEAHRFLEKEAMDHSVTKKYVAEAIIRKYS